MFSRRVTRSPSRAAADKGILIGLAIGITVGILIGIGLSFAWLRVKSPVSVPQEMAGKPQLSDAPLNLALEGTITAVSEGTYRGQKHLARYANDGDTSTDWASQWSMPAWLQLELPKTRPVSAVAIVWGLEAHNQHFSLATSTDGRAWKLVVPSRWSATDALDFSAGATGRYKGNSQVVRERFDFPRTEARYVRLSIDQTQAPSSHIFQARVHELEVY